MKAYNQMKVKMEAIQQEIVEVLKEVKRHCKERSKASLQRVWLYCQHAGKLT